MTKISRRDFLTQSALIGAAGVVVGAGGLLSSCGRGKQSGYVPLTSDKGDYYPDLGDKAIEGKPIRAGLIGCGQRGTGAALNFLDAGDGLSLVAMADLFPDKLEQSRRQIKEAKGVEVADEKTHTGFDAYKKVCEDPDVDLVIIAPPGLFHPSYAEYAVECGKHVFMEKPAGIDPVGCRTTLVALRQAKARGLVFAIGTQYHQSRPHMASYRKVREGYIGKIRSATLKYNQGAATYITRKPGWTDMEYMIRDHFSWGWLCGDHVLDQMVHNVDVFTWFSHLMPISVVSVGSRIRRTTGNIYDNFGVDFIYENNVRVSCQARQISDCANDVSDTIYGELGWWTSKDMAIRDWDGNIVWQYDRAADTAQYQQMNMYVLEHMDLVNRIRSGVVDTPQAETAVVSSLACSMARESAYSGKEILYSDFLASPLSYLPETLELANVPDFATRYAVPLPGSVPPADRAL
jgi:predicted dehydrogenase